MVNGIQLTDAESRLLGFKKEHVYFSSSINKQNLFTKNKPTKYLVNKLLVFELFI